MKSIALLALLFLVVACSVPEVEPPEETVDIPADPVSDDEVADIEAEIGDLDDDLGLGDLDELDDELTLI